MKKHLIKRRAYFYLLYLVFACMMVFGVTYARYTSAVTGKATAKTAAVALNSTLDLTAGLKDIAPGEDREVPFQVTNEKEGVISDVAQEYTITIDTTGNLPLNYTIHVTGSSLGTGEGAAVKEETIRTNVGDRNAPMIWTGGLLPVGSVTHAYTLTISWPASEADVSYADEIEMAALTVDAKQTAPTPAGN